MTARSHRYQERCDVCGRFMKHVWFRVNDEPDGWEDTYKCQPSCMEEYRRREQVLENDRIVWEFNRSTPVGSPVRYWLGVRAGEGKVSTTRTRAQVLSGHSPVVWVEGEAGCIALTHIDAETAIVVRSGGE